VQTMQRRHAGMVNGTTCSCASQAAPPTARLPASHRAPANALLTSAAAFLSFFFLSFLEDLALTGASSSASSSSASPAPASAAKRLSASAAAFFFLSFLSFLPAEAP